MRRSPPVSAGVAARSAERRAPRSRRPTRSTASSARATRSPRADWPSSRPSRSRPARARRRSRTSTSRRQVHAGGQAPHDPRRVQRERQRRLQRVATCRPSSARRTCKPGNGAERPAAQQHPEPGRLRRSRTTTRCGCRTSPPSTSTRCSYTKTGITERVRTDLTGPDGKPGFDISGYTMKNMYEEMSQGRLHRARLRPPRGSPSRTPRPTTARAVCYQDDKGD